MNFKDRLCSTVVSAVTKNAEHVGENLLPCNAAARLQARAPTRNMSPLAQLDCLLENILRELTLRFVVPRLSEFDSLWDTANRICDRYQIKSISSSR
jgi:hypothetical protein